MIPILTIFKQEFKTEKFSTVFKVDVVLGDDLEQITKNPEVSKMVRVSDVQICNYSIGPRGGYQGAAVIGIPYGRWAVINTVIIELNTGLDIGIYRAEWIKSEAGIELVLNCDACGERINSEEVLHHSIQQSHIDGIMSMGG